MFGDEVIRYGIALARWCRLIGLIEPREEIASEHHSFAIWLENTTAAFANELSFIRSLSVDEMDRLGAIDEQLRKTDEPG